VKLDLDTTVEASSSLSRRLGSERTLNPDTLVAVRAEIDFESESNCPHVR